jgi:serine/threonine-protein kinase
MAAPTPPPGAPSAGAPPVGAGPRQTASLGVAPAPDPLPIDPDQDPGLESGQVLGKYRIVRRLGSGGMGSVYEAVHTGIGKPVALKTLGAHLAADPRAQARFLREAASASRLDHPHVVAVTDFGSETGVTYLVMELLRGEDLAALLAQQPDGLDVETLADIMLPVCAGVFAAHEAGVVHRDLKPQNIFISRTPVGDTVPKVLDFGISKLLDESTSGNLTNTGTVIGTTHYLSPEQVSGRPVDGRSDQYSLGVILYECATGRRPHEGDTFYVIMRSIGEGDFRRPRELRPDMPPEFEAVILQAMGRAPSDRFESVHAMGRALLPFASAKRRVLWSDFYERPRPGVVSGAPVAPTAPLPGFGPATPARTRGLEPVPALPSTRTKPGEAPRRALDETPSLAGVPVSGTWTQNTLGRRKPVLAIVAGVAVAAALGAGLLLRSGRQEPATSAGPVPPPPATATASPPAPETPPPPAVEAAATRTPAPPPVEDDPPARADRDGTDDRSRRRSSRGSRGTRSGGGAGAGSSAAGAAPILD